MSLYLWFRIHTTAFKNESLHLCYVSRDGKQANWTEELSTHQFWQPLFYVQEEKNIYAYVENLFVNYI